MWPFPGPCATGRPMSLANCDAGRRPPSGRRVRSLSGVNRHLAKMFACNLHKLAQHTSIRPFKSSFVSSGCGANDIADHGNLGFASPADGQRLLRTLHCRRRHPKDDLLSQHYRPAHKASTSFLSFFGFSSGVAFGRKPRAAPASESNAFTAHECRRQDLRLGHRRALGHGGQGRVVHQFGDVVSGVEENPAEAADRLLGAAPVA